MRAANCVSLRELWTRFGLKTLRPLVKLKPSIELEGPRIFSHVALSSAPLWPGPSLERRVFAQWRRADAFDKQLFLSVA